jgi:small basic protein
MNKRSIVKAASGLIVSVSVGSFTGTMLKQVIPTDISKFRRVAIVAGGSLTASALSTFVQKQTEEQIDVVWDLIDAIRLDLHNKRVKVVVVDESDKEETKADD